MGCRDTRAEKVTSIDQNHTKCDIRTQRIREPEYSVTREEQRALARVMTVPDAPHVVITFTDTTVCFGIHICFTICSTAICGPWSAPVPLVFATCLNRGVLGIRTETLEARSEEALG